MYPTIQRRNLLLIVTLLASLVVTPALAGTPQTIVVDGTNDFSPANLMDDDSLDTQIQNWCVADPEDDAPMDIGKVFVTNDTNNLYIGFEYFRDCFSSPQVNLGMAFSYGAAGDGSTTDPFNRKIAWTTIATKPDNVFYAVLDGFNFEAFYEWQGGATWTNIGSSINPSYGGGSNGLGMANDLGFEELALPLSAFTANGFPGLAAGDTLRLEIWMTQDGTTKPPLDAVASDAVQTSTPTGTVFDTGVAVEMDAMLVYVVQNASDVDPPAITSVRKNPFSDNELLVTFNEPVDAATASNAANYSLLGSTTSVAGASLDLSASNLVHLSLLAPLGATATFYTLSVSNVQDLAGNPVPENTGYEFAVKEVVFRGKFLNYLQNNGTGTDAFTVEGSKEPLDFNLVSDLWSDMTQVDAVNEIWEDAVLFSWGVGPAGTLPKATSLVVEWKFNHNLANWETVGNRILTLNASDPASQVEEHFWDDLDPTQFTSQAIDVVFSVDMSAVAPIPGDTVEIAGDQPPLSFAGPFAGLVDDGTGQDVTAGDNVYSGVVRFPTGSLKNVQYKYVFNAAFECFGASNRGVFLNDAAFDTLGGVLGPIVMPLQTFDRCGVIAGDLSVVFSVDLRNSIYSGTTVAPVVGLSGDVAPLVFDPIGAALPMVDDGLGFDATAGDLIYTTVVTFADSSNANLQYKYVVNGAFEGQTLPNRSVFLDDTFDAASNPQILPLDDVHHTVPTGVDGTPIAGTGLALSAYPNPFNPQTTLRFEVPKRGPVQVEIFDSRGRLLRTLVDAILPAGPQTRVWDGRTNDGLAVGSGVYFARVLAPGAAAATKLVLVK